MLTLAMLMQGLYVAGQNTVYHDSIPFDSSFSFMELSGHFPFGQCFLMKKKGPGATGVKAVLPGGNAFPVLEIDSVGRKLSASISFTDPNTKKVETKVCHADGEKVTTSYSYRISTTNAFQDSDKYLWEITPDPSVPLALSLNLGYGNSRLDLSDLSLRYLNLNSGASDVIVTYAQPNRGLTKAINISGGMSKIVLRNPEYAHAEVVRIQNGMGTTKIMLGDYARVATEYQVEVNAGSLLLILDDQAPVQIILKNTFLSSVEIPETFFNSAPNTYENLAAKQNPGHTSTFVIDLGLGSFSLLTLSKIGTRE